MGIAKLIDATHEGKPMHFHTDGRCRGWSMLIAPGDSFGIHKPESCEYLPKGSGTDEVPPPLPPAPRDEIQPNVGGPKTCCGSNGKRHLKTCEGPGILRGSDGKPLEGYLVDYRSNCCEALVVPHDALKYQCIDCRDRCVPVKQPT